MVEKMQNQNIIFISPSEWHYQQNQLHLTASYFAKNNHVLYVEPPSAFLSAFKNPGAIKKWFASVKQHSENKNLYILSPGLHQSSHARSFKSIGRKIRKAAKKLGLQRPTIITSIPQTNHLLKYFPQSKVVYDCIVQETAASSKNNSRSTKAEDEQQLLRRADLVFTTASAAYKEKKRLNQNCYLVPNLAQIDRFILNEKNISKPDRKTLEDNGVETETAEKLANSDTVIGYIGGIGNWIDLSLLTYLAEQRPRWQFFMFGPLAIDPSKYKKQPNLHFPGFVRYQVQPTLLQSFDIAICPFIHDKLNDTFNALKIYEYLAGGKPVVVSNFEASNDFETQIYTADNKTEFLDRIEEALKKESRFESEGMLPGIRRMRMDFARENACLQRVKQMETILAEKL